MKVLPWQRVLHIKPQRCSLRLGLWLSGKVLEQNSCQEKVQPEVSSQSESMEPLLHVLFDTDPKTNRESLPQLLLPRGCAMAETQSAETSPTACWI